MIMREEVEKPQCESLAANLSNNAKCSLGAKNELIDVRPTRDTWHLRPEKERKDKRRTQ